MCPNGTGVNESIQARAFDRDKKPRSWHRRASSIPPYSKRIGKILNGFQKIFNTGQESRLPSLYKPDMVYKLNRTHGLHRLQGFRLMPLPDRDNRQRPVIQGPQSMKTIMDRPRAFPDLCEAHRLLRQHLREV